MFIMYSGLKEKSELCLKLLFKKAENLLYILKYFYRN